MKGIILDFDGKYVIVVTHKGDFKRIYNNYHGCQVGDEIEIKDSFFGSWISSNRKVLAIAACLLLVVIGCYGVSGFVTPNTYVTMDINPSVELSLNRYERVLEARGLNSDGAAIVKSNREFRNMKLKDALEILLTRAKESEYLRPNKNTVMLTVSNANDSISQDLENQLKDIAETKLNEIEVAQVKTTDTSKNNFTVIVENTTIEKRQEAKKLNISQGKLVLYDKLKKVKPDIAISHVKEASVTQLIREIEEYGPDKKTNTPKSKGNGKGNNLKQQMQDIKIMEKETKEDIKKREKDMKNQFKKIHKELKNDKSKKPEKDKMKDAEKIIKEVLKQERESIKQRRKEIKDKIKDEKKQKQESKQKEKKGKTN